MQIVIEGTYVFKAMDMNGALVSKDVTLINEWIERSSNNERVMRSVKVVIDGKNYSGRYKLGNPVTLRRTY